MLSALVAYNAAGEIIATLDCVVVRSEDGTPVGMVDFAAHEESGGEMTDVWNVENAVGSKVWPEWLSSRAHEFCVEKEGPAGNKRVVALVHKSGHRREREVIEASISQRIAAAEGQPADIRDLVGGPDKPLILDEEGRTVTAVTLPYQATKLPVIRRRPSTSPGRE